MTPLFRKLNLGAHDTIHVLDAPPSFEAELAPLAAVTVERTLAGRTAFALAFVVTQADLDAVSRRLVEAAEEDAVLWMVYPKASSKRYRCEFNRDSGWAVLGAAGFEPVRMVAVDEDWSALRFRRVEHIERMTRDPARAISDAGGRKTKKARRG